MSMQVRIFQKSMVRKSSWLENFKKIDKRARCNNAGWNFQKNDKNVLHFYHMYLI